MTWLEWRHTRLPLALLVALALALAAGYKWHLLVGMPPFAQVEQLGPWATGTSCYLYEGQLTHLRSYCTVPTLFAGRWFDWWTPLLVTLVGAHFGSRVRDAGAFLRLQPLQPARVLGTRLAFGVLVLSATVLLSAALVNTRGTLSFDWWPGEEVMRQFWLGTLLVWLRGLTVLLLAGALAQLLPSALAALLAAGASLALLGVQLDPFVRRITLEYTPAQFAELLHREATPISLVQHFIALHAPDQLRLLPGVPGWGIIAGADALLLLVLLALQARQRV